MKSLDHPLKRLAFLLSIIGGLTFVMLAVLPSPVEIETYEEWKDVVGTESADRQVTRINTKCAAEVFGGVAPFARDFQIIDAFASENPYSRIITEDIIDKGQGFDIAAEVDLTQQEMALFDLQLQVKEPICLKGVCVAKLDAPLFTKIVASCSKPASQHRHEISGTKWRMLKNLETASPWSQISIISAVAFLLFSLFYEKTIGRLVKWIRTGLW
jgi:hypothetical protein